MAIFALLERLDDVDKHTNYPAQSQSKAGKKPAAKANKLAHSKAVYQRWFRDMYLMRKFEERCGQLYIQQKFGGFCHLYIGQEAVLGGHF